MSRTPINKASTAFSSSVVPRFRISCNSKANPPLTPSPEIDGGFTAYTTASSIFCARTLKSSMMSNALFPFPLRSSQFCKTTKSVAALESSPPSITEYPLIPVQETTSGYSPNNLPTRAVTSSVRCNPEACGSCTETIKYP